VALRVVNRIEKEVVEAEYEHWLLDETHKCERVGAMIEGSGKDKEKEVEEWVRGYCGDCRRGLEGEKQGKEGPQRWMGWVGGEGLEVRQNVEQW
jgi:hypothetical protein